MILDHIDAISRSSTHNVHVLSNLGDLPKWLDLGRFDAIIIHYSIFACIDAYLSPYARYQIKHFNGLKAIFLQDEYRFVENTIEAITYLEIHLLFTTIPSGEIEKVYPQWRLPRLRKINVLTGYVTPYMRSLQSSPLCDRPVCVGYRGRKYPAWHGELGLEKWQIGEKFEQHASRYGLTSDISWREEDRLYGKDWFDFLGRCRAQLGVESGSSVFDWTGEISAKVDEHCRNFPDTPYEELKRLYFQGKEGEVKLNQISPRIFEAAAMKCLLVLYEGEYSGVLTPWRHYVPLKKDYSNISEVIAFVCDLSKAQEMVDRTHREIIEADTWFYGEFVRQLDRHINDSFQPSMARARLAYSRWEFQGRARFGTVIFEVVQLLRCCKELLPFRGTLSNLVRLFVSAVSRIPGFRLLLSAIEGVASLNRYVLLQFAFRTYVNALNIFIPKRYRAMIYEHTRRAWRYALRMRRRLIAVRPFVSPAALWRLLNYQLARRQMDAETYFMLTEIVRIAKRLKKIVNGPSLAVEFDQQAACIKISPFCDQRFARQPIEPSVRLELGNSSFCYRSLVWEPDSVLSPYGRAGMGRRHEFTALNLKDPTTLRAVLRILRRAPATFLHTTHTQTVPTRS